MRKALFLDRDGVINVDRDFVHRVEDFVWQDGIFELIRRARVAGFMPVVVTNQSGIGRGYYGEHDFEALTRWMCDELARHGAAVERVYHCPYHPEAVLPNLRAEHSWRKPKPGMFLAARDDLGLDLPASVMIGDRWSDAEAAHAAGVGTILIVGTAHPPVPAGLPPLERPATIRDATAWLAAHYFAGDPAGD